eukprot:2683922-Rhodomonas_salina.1
MGHFSKFRGQPRNQGRAVCCLRVCVGTTFQGFKGSVQLRLVELQEVAAVQFRGAVQRLRGRRAATYANLVPPYAPIRQNSTAMRQVGTARSRAHADIRQVSAVIRRARAVIRRSSAGIRHCSAVLHHFCTAIHSVAAFGRCVGRHVFRTAGKGHTCKSAGWLPRRFEPFQTAPTRRFSRIPGPR